MAEVVSLFSQVSEDTDVALVESLYAGLHAFDCMCAWCLQNANMEPQEGDSHGICTYHANEMKENWRAYRAGRRA